MKKTKAAMLLLLFLLNSILTVGCWNYKEVDEFLVVAGTAVDKAADDQYKLTVETVKISGGKETKATSLLVEGEGKTMFEAARNIIDISGKRLYWSHAKIIIVSKKVAEDDMKKVVEWYTRDAETREDAVIIISKEETAKEILNAHAAANDIISFSLDKTLKNQKSLGSTPTNDILEYNNDTQSKGKPTIVPAVNLKEVSNIKVPQLSGAAIIKNNKLVGFLNGEETKCVNFIKDKIKGGILVENIKGNDEDCLVSLEIFKSRTKTKIITNNSDILMTLNIEMNVALGESCGEEEITDEQKKIVENKTESTLKQNIEDVVKKVQNEYDADVLGFGVMLMQEQPQVWKTVEDNWDDVFKRINVDVKTKVNIKNTAVIK